LLVSGNSVIVVPSLASDEECEALSDEGHQAVLRGSLARGVSPPSCVRLPLMVRGQSREDASKAKDRCEQDLQNWSSQAALSEAADAIGETIFLRVLGFVDEHFPSIAQRTFGAGKGSAPSLVEMYTADELEYAPYEPAVNVYGVTGGFEPHKDYHGLTMLLALSAPDAFVDGGTAFWSGEAAADELEEPSLVLKPSRGSVLLFGGQVMHSALSIKAGSRLVFVGSFSHKCFKPPGGFGDIFG